MPLRFLVQLNYGEGGQAVLECDLARYLGVLLRVAACAGVSVSERNTVASAAYILADKDVRQAAFTFSAMESPDWDDLLLPLSYPPVAASLFRDACQVAWADGQLDEEERALLERIARTLGLQADLTEPLLAAVEVQERARQQLVSLISATQA